MRNEVYNPYGHIGSGQAPPKHPYIVRILKMQLDVDVSPSPDIIKMNYHLIPNLRVCGHFGYLVHLPISLDRQTDRHTHSRGVVGYLV